MDRRSFAIALPAAAALLVGCQARSKSAITLDADTEDSLRRLEAAIGGLEMDINNMRDSSCGDMATAVGGAASAVRTSFDNLKEALGSPKL